MKTKNFNCRGRKWSKVELFYYIPSKTTSIIISRPVSQSQIKKYGQIATAIEVTKEELPKHVLKNLRTAIPRVIN